MSTHERSARRTGPDWLLFVLCLGCLVVTSGLSAPRSLKEKVPCTATLAPTSVIARQFDDSNTSHQVIRCSARIGKESFINPVFDLSFGLTPITGIFILRGKKECSPDNQRCWSDFKVPSKSLRELLLPSDEQENAITNAGDNSHRMSHVSSVIEYTCNVADSSRNSSFAVRCADSGTIRFAKVLKYGDRCSSALTAVDECDQNMECPANRCVCKQGFMPYSVTRTEVICVEKAGLGERCNFTRQCNQMIPESLCEYEASLKFRICKCLSGYEEVNGVQNQLYCAPISDRHLPRAGEPSTSSKSPTETDVAALTVGAKETEDVEVFQVPDKKEKDAQMKSGDDLKSRVLKFGKAYSVGLIVLAGVILMAILLVAIIIRLRNHGEMKVKNNHQEPQNGKGKREDTQLLAAAQKLSDEEEEVDVRIDEHTDHQDGPLIDYERASEETDVDGHESRHEEEATNLDEESNRPQSNFSQASDNDAANFNYNSRQSVV